MLSTQSVKILNNAANHFQQQIETMKQAIEQVPEDCPVVNGKVSIPADVYADLIKAKSII